MKCSKEYNIKFKAYAVITVSKLYGFLDKEWQQPDSNLVKDAKENAGLENIFYNDKYFIKKKNTSKRHKYYKSNIINLK